MLNPFCEVNWKPSITERRLFARSIAIGLPVVAGVLGGVARLHSGLWPVWPPWLAAISAAIGLLLWLVPQMAGPFYTLWYGLGCCAGFIVSNATAAAIYFLVITPVGLLLRFAGRDPLDRRMERDRTTYWKDATKTDDAERIFRQY